MTDSSVKSGLMRVLGSIAFRHVPLHDLTLAHPHDGADPRDYAFLDAIRCSRNRQPPGYLALQPFGTDVVRDLCEVYPAPFSWPATQRNHPCDMSLFESYRRCTQSMRQEMSRFLPLPTSINVEGPTLLGPLPKYHMSPHISVDFVCFASPVSFRHVLRVFYLSGWSLSRGRCRVVNHNALFPCFVTPSTTSLSHLKESPTMDLYRCQSYTPLARYHLLAHENSQFRLSSTSSFGSLPPATSL